jgi:hypothetical protein
MSETFDRMSSAAPAHDAGLSATLAFVGVQGAIEDICQLLIMVRVLWQNAAFVEVDVREHHAFAGDETAGELVSDLLLGEVAPAEVADEQVGHR